MNPRLTNQPERDQLPTKRGGETFANDPLPDAGYLRLASAIFEVPEEIIVSRLLPRDLETDSHARVDSDPPVLVS